MPGDWIFPVGYAVLAGVTLWAVVDALRLPDEAWRAAGRSKTAWVLGLMLLTIPTLLLYFGISHEVHRAWGNRTSR